MITFQGERDCKVCAIDWRLLVPFCPCKTNRRFRCGSRLIDSTQCNQRDTHIVFLSRNVRIRRRRGKEKTFSDREDIKRVRDGITLQEEIPKTVQRAMEQI